MFYQRERTPSKGLNKALAPSHSHPRGGDSGASGMTSGRAEQSGSATKTSADIYLFPGSVRVSSMSLGPNDELDYGF